MEELREEMRRYQTANRLAMDRQDSRIREIKRRQDDQDKLMSTAVFTHADFEAALLRTLWNVITDKRALTLLVILAVVAGIAGDTLSWLVEQIRGFGEVPSS